MLAHCPHPHPHRNLAQQVGLTASGPRGWWARTQVSGLIQEQASRQAFTPPEHGDLGVSELHSLRGPLAASQGPQHSGLPQTDALFDTGAGSVTGPPLFHFVVTLNPQDHLLSLAQKSVQINTSKITEGII